MTVSALPAEERDRLRSLLDERSPRDALAAYYALYHPAPRVRLFVSGSGPDAPAAFALRAQTGQDLFRPLLTLRAPDSGTAAELLRAALPPRQPAYVSAPLAWATWVAALFECLEQTVLELYTLRAAQFEPLVNVFVSRSLTPGGLPRYEIRQGEHLAAAAGVNWQSPQFAEIFVHTDPASRERGYGRSVAAALCNELLENRRTPLYAVGENNPSSLNLARSIGFADSGEREFVCIGALKPEPMPPDTDLSSPGAPDA